MHPNFKHLLFLLSFCLTNVFACDDLLPANLNEVKMPAMNTGQPGLGGIIDFGAKNDDCTLDCRCTYNTKINSWEVATPPNRVCVFMNQCKHCKSTDKECEIRFANPQSSSMYKETFYADDPNASKIQQCSYETSKSIVCKDIPRLPTYDQVKPV